MKEYQVYVSIEGRKENISWTLKNDERFNRNVLRNYLKELRNANEVEILNVDRIK
jgi:hypothetical protein